MILWAPNWHGSKIVKIKMDHNSKCETRTLFMVFHVTDHLDLCSAKTFLC